MPKRLRTGKPKVLRRKNVKRRTSAKSQSRQIMALSRQVSSITRRQFEKCHTTWQRALTPIDRAVTDQGTAYICPIPYVPCTAVGSATGAGSQRLWTDNLSPFTELYGKKVVFGLPENAAGSNEVYHTGGNIKYQITTNEPSLTKYSLFLIRPKKVHADQLVKDRKMKTIASGGTVPGGECFLTPDLDYVVHRPGTVLGLTQSFFGAQMNRKYWDVLYSREITLGQPGGLGGGTTDFPAATRTSNSTGGGSPNTVCMASGSIKLPAGGLIKLSAVEPQEGGTNAAQATSWEVNYDDQTNEASCYLVCINNGITTDGESANMALIVHDYYKAVC